LRAVFGYQEGPAVRLGVLMCSLIPNVCRELVASKLAARSCSLARSSAYASGTTLYPSECRESMVSVVPRL